MKKKILYEGKFLRVIGEGGWEYVKRKNCTGIVVIAALTRDKKIILVEQYRKPVGKNVIEMPAGLVGDIESQAEEKIETAAMRELLEETGYQAKKMKLLMHGPVSAGLSCEIISIYQAINIKKVSEGGGDETEDITVYEVPLKRAQKWLRQMEQKGKLVDPKVYAGIYFLIAGAK